MWRPRDRERFIGGYDPEREMPDPDRDPGDRWQSPAYRHNSRDTRFAYRWNPDRFEGRFGQRERGPEPRDWDRDARDRDRDYDRGGYEGSGPLRDRGWGSDRGWDNAGYNSQRGRFGSDYDRGGWRDEGWEPSRFDRDRWRR